MKPTAGSSTPDPHQLNMMQRSAVLGNSVEMKQQIFSQTIAAPTSSTNVIHLQPRNVGLIKQFIVVVDATLNNTDGAKAATPADFALSNILSQITFTDLNNNQRIQTSGRHLHFVSSLKRRTPFASADVSTSLVSEVLNGDNFACIIKPASIAASTSAAVRTVYSIPCAYSDDDLRGAVYANVVNATMDIALTINTSPFADVGADSTFAVYKGSVGTITAVTIRVYQVYLDQLPVGNKGVVLPILDLSTVYELKNTTFSKMVASTEFQIPYANFRDFISTLAIFNSDASADTGRHGGSDVNYWALQSATFTNIWKLDPVVAALDVRKHLRTDLPPGAYYFDHRRKPISTTQYGNMELILNASTAAASAYTEVGWEDFAFVNTLSQAGSLAG